MTPEGPEIRYSVHRADPRLLGATVKTNGWVGSRSTARPKDVRDALSGRSRRWTKSSPTGKWLTGCSRIGRSLSESRWRPGARPVPTFRHLSPLGSSWCVLCPTWRTRRRARRASSGVCLRGGGYLRHRLLAVGAGDGPTGGRLSGTLGRPVAMDAAGASGRRPTATGV